MIKYIFKSIFFRIKTVNILIVNSMKNKHRFNSSQETQQTTKHDSLMSSSVKCVCRLLYLNQYFVKSIIAYSFNHNFKTNN